MNDKSIITIGKTVAPHGVRGDIRVVPLTDYPERFQNLTTVRLDDGRVLTVESVKYHKSEVLLKFRGFDDRTAVESLRGKLLQIDRADAVALPEGHYFIFDIIGLEVFDQAGTSLGRVADVLATGANDVYITEREGRQPLLIPAIKDVVLNIDIPGGRMVVKLQEEWD